MEPENGQQNSEAEIRQLVDQLGNRSEEKQKQAKQTLLRIGPACLDILLDVLKRESAKRKRRMKTLFIYTGTVYLFWLGFIALPFVGSPESCIYLGLIAMLVIWAGFFSFIPGSQSLYTRYRNAIQLLSEFGDIRSLGSLLEAIKTIHDKSLIRSRLITLLPQLQATDADLLKPEQRHFLHQLLLGNDTELIVASLKALEQVGDTTAVPYVQKLALGEVQVTNTREFRTRNRINLLTWLNPMFWDHGWPDKTRIRAAAQECLPFLEAKAEGKRITEQLLRPTDAPAAPAHLLRPVNAVSDDHSEQLLRAGSQGNNVL